MKNILLLSILIAFLLITCSAQTINTLKKQNSTNSLGKVKIIVLGTNWGDESDKELDESLDIQPFRVYLQGRKFFKEMVYHHNSEFELEVSKGIYNIVLKRNFEEPLPYQRANFYVAPNKTIKMKIDIGEGGIGACDDKFGFVNVVESHNLNLKEFKLQNYYKTLINYPYQVVVKYCHKEINKGVSTLKFALLTYKNITIYADKMTFDKKNLTVEANGNKDSNVIVEIENCRKETKKLKLNLKIPNLLGLICK